MGSSSPQAAILRQRPFAQADGRLQHEHSIATINIHESYTHQLANERAQNACLRQREIENGARLASLSRLLREAYQLETLEPDATVMERLKAENATLRAALGVESDGADPEELD